jgi:hypothetical protein
MLIPNELTLLLAQLFGSKVKGGKVKPPALEKRIEIYLEALGYAEKDLKLFVYVLGYRRIVTLHGCKIIDDLLLEYMCRDPRIIPSDFRQRLPKKAYIVQFAERLYMRDKEYKKV